GVYYRDEEDKPVIEAALDELAKRLDKPVVVACEPLRNFYLAEEYHQDYLKKHPGGYCHISDAMCRAAAKAQPYERPDK
ncbi:MAG TPA: peptide-methionine (S)-S-oxide reductase, partial [Clostridia bacterium]|nr:peptide-methionine (S)-S-oxide reductase [Clostridia bacterium]